MCWRLQASTGLLGKLENDHNEKSQYQIIKTEPRLPKQKYTWKGTSQIPNYKVYLIFEFNVIWLSNSIPTQRHLLAKEEQVI